MHRERAEGATPALFVTTILKNERQYLQNVTIAPYDFALGSSIHEHFHPEEESLFATRSLSAIPATGGRKPSNQNG
jgi:hypothetical protein